MFFKQDKNKDETYDLTKIAALLIHAAKIDENYSKEEEEIIKKTLLKIGANNQNIEEVISKGKLIEENFVWTLMDYAGGKSMSKFDEGVVALLEPFIDTVVICTMTALVIIMYNSAGIFEYGGDIIIDGKKVEGAVLNSMDFAYSNPWFPILLTISIL